MAIQTSVIFKGFSGSVNRQLLFRQFAGKTVVSKFPDRSAVVYSERQKREQKRFSDAVSFARVVIANEGLKQDYSIKAALLGFRSAWNVAIAEYMSDLPLKVKKKKIRFDQSLIRMWEGQKIQVKLFKTIEPEAALLVRLPQEHKEKKNISYNSINRQNMLSKRRESIAGFPLVSFSGQL